MPESITGWSKVQVSLRGDKTDVVFLKLNLIKRLPKFFRVIIYIFGGLILLSGILYLLLRSPAVQTYLTGKITNQLSGQLNTELSIEGVDIDFFTNVVLEEIYLEDQQQDTLLYAGRLEVDIGLFALMSKRVTIDMIGLENAYVNLHTIGDTGKMNFEFIPEAFASDTTQQDTTSSDWDFDLHKVLLEKVRFRYHDRVNKTLLSLAVNTFLVDLETLGLAGSHIRANEININGLNLAFSQPPSPAENLPDTVKQVTQADTAKAGTGADSLNPSGFKFTVEDLIIEDSNIRYRAGGKAAKGKMDFANLDIKNLALAVSNIDIGAGSVAASIRKFALTEQNSGFRLQELALDVAVDMPSVKAELTALRTGHSQLNGEISVEIPSIRHTETLLEDLRLGANFRKTVIGLRDVAYFMDALDSMPEIAGMDVQLGGKLAVQAGAASIDQLALNLGDQAKLRADMTIDDLVNVNTANLDLTIHTLSTDFGFISKLMPPGSLPPELRKAGALSLTARAGGNLSNIDLKATIHSTLGKILANINYKGREAENFSVRGDIDGYDISLGRLTGSDSLGNLTFSSAINADFGAGSIRVDSLNLTVESLEFNHYTYKDMNLKASFKDSLLLANVRYEDPYLKMFLDASADLNKDSPRTVLDGRVDVNLFRLHLSPDSILLKTTIDADMKGFDPDSLNGYVKLLDAVLIKGAREFQLDTFQLTALTTDTARSIRFRSDFIQAELAGKFSFASLPGAIEDFKQHYFTAYKLKQERDSVLHARDQSIRFTARIKENPGMLEAFVPALSIPEPVDIYASYRAEDHFLEADITVPEIVFAENRIEGLVIEAGTRDKNIQFGIAADHAAVGEDLVIQQPSFSGSFIQDMMQFNLALANTENPSYLNFNGFLTNKGDTIVLDILESSMAIDGQPWQMPQKGKVVYAPQYLLVNDVTLLQEAQKITLNTRGENSDASILSLDVSNLDIGAILKILGMGDYKVQSRLNGSATVVNALKLQEARADFSFSDLVVDKQEMADIRLMARKPRGKQQINLELSMDGPQNQFYVTGNYNLADTANSLDFKVDMQKFRLEQWAVFAEEFVTDLAGNLRAGMQITGSPERPVVEGFLAFDPESRMRIKAVGALYKFDDQRITFTQQAIHLPGFTILDSAGHQVVIDGSITHQYFSDFVFDLAVTTEEFKFFNAEKHNSPSFYGSVNVRADLDITGPMDNMVVSGEVETLEGTSPVIAMVDEPGVVERAPYIHFVNTNAYAMADSTAKDSVTVNNTVEIKGLSLNLRLAVTPEAILTIVVDPVNGDHLLAQGEGDFLVQMTPTGEMNIQGAYRIDRGSYALSFMGVVKKEFDIRKGSRISLTGNPMYAGFDISAVYHTEASADALIQAPPGDVEAQQRLKVKQPVNVILSLEGTLEEPEISFDIEMPAQKDMYSPIAQRIEMIKNDKTQLYQQVFGLIVLNRFIPSSGPLSGGGGATAVVNQRIDASVSSMLTTQLSRLTEDYLGGVELAVNLESQDESSAAFEDKDLQVELTKQINDRITLTVGGTSALGGGGESGGVAGNFEILYRINKSGTLNLRIFQKNDRDIFTNEFKQIQGTSISFRKSFDRFFPKKEEVLKGNLPPDVGTSGAGQDL